jgi:hypothetical protein
VDEVVVRQHAEAMCDALVDGDVDRATADISDELRRHMGEVVALLPLPVSEAVVESIERGGASINALLRLVGETETVRVQTRWKDRDGVPRIVEASHLSRDTRVDQAEGPQAEGPRAEGPRGEGRQAAEGTAAAEDGGPPAR